MAIGFILAATIIGERVIGRSEEANIGMVVAGIRKEKAGTGGVAIGVENITHEWKGSRKESGLSGCLMGFTIY